MSFVVCSHAMRKITFGVEGKICTRGSGLTGSACVRVVYVSFRSQAYPADVCPIWPRRGEQRAIVLRQCSEIGQRWVDRHCDAAKVRTYVYKTPA